MQAKNEAQTSAANCRQESNERYLNRLKIAPVDGIDQKYIQLGIAVQPMQQTHWRKGTSQSAAENNANPSENPHILTYL